ncbi:MAG: ABC transporter permease [Anaerolineae bacterium]|nr:ABC transporter permease [Anaerolineales bacterium]MCQ3977606.1 ABC transporter permease [Anaerolineae bacterium]
MSFNYLLRRTLQALPLLFLASLVVFLLIHITPGDPVRLMLGEQASDEQIAAVRARIGLDRSLPEQYLSFIGRALQGDLGTSIRAVRPTVELIGLALPATLLLTAVALFLAVVIGLPVGILAALRPGSLFDNLALFLALLGQSIPSFWLGLTLISFIALRWRLLPTSGYGDWQHLVLPACSLAPFLAGLIIRITRTSFIEVLRQDYIRTAYAKGFALSPVVFRHALRNALLPIVTILGLQTGALLGGAVVTETVFGWPGVGQLAVNALSDRDYPVVQAVVLVSALIFISINLLVDLAYSILDPRIRYQ